MKKRGLLFALNIQLFADEEKEEAKDESQEDNTDYVEAIQKLKENSVAKEKYEKLEQDNKKLLQALIDGEQIQVENQNNGDKPDVNKKISDLHKKMFVDDYQGSDLEYCQDALELRKAVMERDGEDADIFLPRGHNIMVTDYDRKAAQRVADEMQDAIEKSNGSNKVFIALLQQKTVDDLGPAIRRRK